MSALENGKRRRVFYDIAAAFEDLQFTEAFGPGILAALFYGLVSGSMSFVNKVSLNLGKVLCIKVIVKTTAVFSSYKILSIFSLILSFHFNISPVQ